MLFDDIQPVNPDAGDQFSGIQQTAPEPSGPIQFSQIQPIQPPQPDAEDRRNGYTPSTGDDPRYRQKVGPIGAAVAGAAPAVAPVTAAIGAGVRGAALGTALFPELAPWSTIGGGLAAGLIASGVVGKIQDWLRDKYGPSTGPLSKEYEAAAAAQHPLAYNVGRAAPIAAGMTTGNVSPAVRAGSAALFGGVDVLQQGITKGFGNIDPTEALVQAGAGAVLPQAREWAGGARPGLATEKPAVYQEGTVPSGGEPGTGAIVPKTNLGKGLDNTGAVEEPQDIAERQDQASKTAPFNTPPAKGVAAPQPPVPGANIQHGGAPGPDERYGATILGSGSDRMGLKDEIVGPGTRVDGAPTTVVETPPADRPVPADVSAAISPEPPPTSPAAPAPPVAGPALGPAEAPVAQAPVQSPQPSVPTSPSAAPTFTGRFGRPVTAQPVIKTIAQQIAKDPTLQRLYGKPPETPTPPVPTQPSAAPVPVPAQQLIAKGFPADLVQYLKPHEAQDILSAEPGTDREWAIIKGHESQARDRAGQAEAAQDYLRQRPTEAAVATARRNAAAGQPPRLPPDQVQQVIHDAIVKSADRDIVKEPMPSIANSSNDPDGPITIDPHADISPEYQRLLAAHETIEDELEKLGFDPKGEGHDLATMGEKSLAEAMGVDWDKYSKTIARIAPEIEGQTVTPEMRARWQAQGLHIDPMEDIGHHTNKEIQGDLQHDLQSPDLGQVPPAESIEKPSVPQAENTATPEDLSISPFLRRQPTKTQEAIAQSTGRPQPQSLGAAVPGASEGEGGMGSGKVPPPNAIHPDPHDPTNPAADPTGQAYADSLYDRFNLMRSRLRNAYQSMRDYYMKAPKQTNEEWEQIGKAYTRHEEDQLPANLLPAYEYFRDRVAPKQQEVARQVYALNKKWGWLQMDDPDAESPTRFLSRQEVSDEVVPRGEDVLTGQNMTGWDPSTAPRDFKLAVEAGEDGHFRPDGKSFLVKDNGDGTSLTRWDGKEPAKYDYQRPGADPDNPDISPLNVGDHIKVEGKDYMIGHADAHHVEDQGLINPLTGNPIEYNKNALTASMVSTEGLLRSRDIMKLLDDIITDPKYKDEFVVGGSREAEAEAKAKWGGLYKTNLDQFQGTPGKPLYMSQATAQALNDFKKPGFKTPDWLTNTANALIKTLYVPGFPIHDLNVGAQWFIGKPWAHTQAWQGLLQDFPKAYKDVMSQGDLQQEIRHAGGSTQLFSVLDDANRETVYRNAGQEMVKNSPFWQKVADKAGINVPQLAQDVYDYSRRNMWKINDMLYTQQYMTFKRMGMSPEEAVKATEQFIPNYRINNKVLGQRWLAQLYKTPGLSLFGPYHAGLWSSWQRVMVNAATGNPDERKAAIVSMIAMGVAGMFIKPYILDPIAKAATGNPNAEFAPRGMLTIPSQLGKIATGQQGYESAVPNLFTPSLPVSAATSAVRNLDWAGQPLIPRNDLRRPGNVVRAGLQGVDAAGKLLLPPYSTVASNLAEKGTSPGRALRKEITGNLGIRDPSQASVNYLANIKQNNARLQKEHRPGPLERGYNKLTGQ